MMLTNRRGSVSTPSIPTLNVSSSSLTLATTAPTLDQLYSTAQQSPCTHSSTPAIAARSNSNNNKPPPSKGQRLIQRAISYGQSKLHLSASSLTNPSAFDTTLDSTTSATTHSSTTKTPSTASTCTVEVLTLIFRHLMDRKSILNCSLVSTHWHGPARVELARIVQDMPFNGLGLVHAIRMRFAQDTFPFLSMALFDKLVCELSQLYYHSNPETRQVFAPAHAPDMLYHLFWTFLFIDQEFRHPKARTKVTCAYFIRLLQNEGGGYPQKYFDKKVLKSIYNDIRARPLLPAPYLIRALQDVEGPFPNIGDNPSAEITTTTTPNNSSGSSNSSNTRPTGLHSRQSSLMNLASSIRFEESIKRIRQWWKNVRDEGDKNQVGWVSHVDLPVTPTTATIVTTTLVDGSLGEIESISDPIESSNLSLAPGSTLLPTPSSSNSYLPSTNTTDAAGTSTIPGECLSGSTTFPHGSVQSLDQSIRSKFGSKSDLNLGHQRSGGSSNNGNSWTVMNQGYTTVSHGWHAEGDGLDRIVSFPKPTKPSALVEQGHLIRCASVLDMELVL
ncbi:MAG: hypothetical protein J3R72DRAFT_446241 [Linnemannia gamsii]|nr:MAG: hypothetical protein J3R72DRAFT_446241 [Linnemannia gamsii]